MAFSPVFISSVAVVFAESTRPPLTNGELLAQPIFNFSVHFHFLEALLDFVCWFFLCSSFLFLRKRKWKFSSSRLVLIEEKVLKISNQINCIINPPFTLFFHVPKTIHGKSARRIKIVLNLFPFSWRSMMKFVLAAHRLYKADTSLWLRIMECAGEVFCLCEYGWIDFIVLAFDCIEKSSW
jgi:hypothetical protein